MNLENVFEIIRKENAIIWAGAGMSIYAGFPSGNELRNLFIQALNENEKLALNRDLALPELTEEIYRIKGNSKNFLISRLKEIFKDVQSDVLTTHKELSQIPHIKSIITTNYDTAFETAYGNSGQKVYSSKCIAYLDKEKSQIFKIHGDLIDPDSIILTSSDYNNFFKNDSENNLLWTLVSERIASNSVVFIGYNLEDPNVSVVFDKISEELGDNRKECFFIAPNLVKHKVNSLIKRNIHYIDATSEEFVAKLLQNIKDNILSDFENNKVSPDTLRRFLAKRDFYPELKANDDKFKLIKLSSKADTINGRISFTLNEKNKDLEDIFNGKRLGTIILDKSHIVKSDIWYGDLKLPNSEGENILSFSPSPKIDSNIDIRFKNGFEFNNIDVKVFGAKTEIRIEATLKNADISLNFHTKNHPNLKLDFAYKHSEYCHKISDEIQLFKFMKLMSEGDEHTIFTKGGDKFQHSFPQMPPVSEQADLFLEHFQNLKNIELFFNVFFSKIKFESITKKDLAISKRINSIIENGELQEDWTGKIEIEFIRTEINLEALMKLEKPSTPIVVENDNDDIVTIHNLELNLGPVDTQVLNPSLINLDELIKGETNMLQIHSKTQKIISKYRNLKKASL